MKLEQKNGKTNSEPFKKEISTICDAYLQMFPDEKERLSQLQSVLAKPNLDLRSRSTIPEGHMCASGIIVSDDLSHILMVLHKKLGIWVVPGGHYDFDDESLEKTAIRETNEETGLTELAIHPWHTINGIPLDIDSHSIPANATKNEDSHTHFDFRYALTVPSSEILLIDPRELLGFQWINLTEIDPNSSIAPAVAKLRLLHNT